MKDKYKKKQQLIDELVQARRQLDALNTRYRRLVARGAETVAAAGGRPQRETISAPRIGEILIDMGCLTEAQLRLALQEQEREKQGKPLGRILVESGVVTEKQLQFGLMKQYMSLRSRVLGSLRQRAATGRETSRYMLM